MIERSTETRSVIMHHGKGVLSSVGKDLAGADAAEPYRGVADEERFLPQIGHSFELRGDWGSVTCKVLEIEPNRTLTYCGEANGLDSVVKWTLVPSATERACACSIPASTPVWSSSIRVQRPVGPASPHRWSRSWREQIEIGDFVL